MEADELRSLLREGENEEVEFKKTASKPELLAQVLAGFANSTGGVLLVGVDDRGGILGVDDPRQVAAALVDAAARHIQPPLSVSVDQVEVDGRNIVVGRIPAGSRRPYLADGLAVARVGPRLIRLDGEALITMLRSSTEPQEAQLERLTELVAEQSEMLATQDARLAGVQKSVALGRQVALLIAGSLLGAAITIGIDLLK